MAGLPYFSFPPARECEISGHTHCCKKEKPNVQLNTNFAAREGYHLTVPRGGLLRPTFVRTITPPDSPSRTRSRTMDSPHSPKLHASGAMTPPSTPIHSKSGSASSDFLASLSDRRRGDSISSRSSRPSLDDSASPGSMELLVFPHHLTDYHIKTDGGGNIQPIGEGAWSRVYLATPSLPPAQNLPITTATSPPLTPSHSRGSSKESTALPSTHALYAIKMPSSTSAKKVLNAEAQVLSYLTRFPSASQHIVPFYGQDPRTGALVLGAKFSTLESWIQTELNTLDPTSRAQKLAASFPSIALSLIDSLIWMQDKHCIHADIKPSNILVSPSLSSTSTTPSLVFSDFSSTLLTNLPTSSSAPAGAGTWDFLDPSLLSAFTPATPCAATDLYSLGITLLFVILGQSPFEAFRLNTFQMREMIKSGSPLQCLQYDDQGIKNVRVLKALSEDLGFDVVRWLGKVLVKSLEKRVGVEVWREELVKGLAAV